MDYFETNDATFNPNLEKISETDRVHASVPNERFEQLIKNDVALKNSLDTHNHNDDYAEKNHKHEEYIISEELGASLTGVAKESSEYSIENKVQEVVTTVGNINNSVSQNLQGVAKERSEYSIEDKVKELDKKIQYLEEREKIKNWTLLPNLKTFEIYNLKYQDFENSKELLNISGSGHLIISYLNIQAKTGIVNLKIEIDDNIIFDVEVDNTDAQKAAEIGIVNDECLNYETKYNTNIIAQYIRLINDNEIYTRPDKDFAFEISTIKRCCRWINLSNEKRRFKVKDTYSFDTYVRPATVLTRLPIPFNKNLKITLTDNNTVTENTSFVFKCIYNLNE